MKINVYDLLYDYDKDGRMTSNNGVNYTYIAANFWGEFTI